MYFLIIVFLINTMIDDSSDVAVLPGPLFHRTGEISFLKLGRKNMMEGKRKEGKKGEEKEKRGELREKKLIRGIIWIKPFTQGGKDIFPPNLYGTCGINIVLEKRGRRILFFGKIYTPAIFRKQSVPVPRPHLRNLPSQVGKGGNSQHSRIC